LYKECFLINVTEGISQDILIDFIQKVQKSKEKGGIEKLGR